MKIWPALTALFRRGTIEADMAEEMRLHLERRVEENVASGMSPEDARYAALRKFGGVEQVKEQCREQRSWIWLEQLLQDLRFGVRGLRRARGFTTAAAVTLALGIGMTTSIFSVVYGVLLEPYPYAKSDEIWAPEIVDEKTRRPLGLRMTDYLEMAKLPAVESAMATSYATVTLSGGINPEIVTSPQVTGTTFAFLDVPPVLGRGLTPSDFEPSGEARAVTVLSFKLWRRLFNGDPGALGKTVVLDDVPHEIVGVMPPRFGWYTNDGLWRPLPTLDHKRGVRPIMRLKPGATSAVAAEQLKAMIQEQAKREPGRFPKDGFSTSLKNYLDVTVASGSMRTSLILLLFAVGFLLLIVCTNVANLQLARGVGRNREMAVRLALGAGRGRLFRQLLTESVVLSLAGGALGVGFAYGLLQIIVTLLPPNYVPNEARITINGWVLAFSAGIAVLTGVLSGLVPGWQCTRPDVNESLKDGGQGAGAGSHRGNRTRNILVVAQIAVSVVLVAGAALAARGFAELQRLDRGFVTERMLLLDVPLDGKRYTGFEQRNAFFRGFLDRVRALPGVSQATLGLPPGTGNRSGVTIPGQPRPADGLSLNYIDPEYLGTLGIALKAGRNLTGHDVALGERVALVNETAARLWGDSVSPIGRTIEIDALVGGGPNNLPIENASKQVTVVGIVADTRVGRPTEPIMPVVFVPYSLRAPTARVISVRTLVEPHTIVNAVRAELRALDPEQPMQAPITFEEVIDERFLKQPRFNLALLGTLGGLALVLAAAGIYSVLSYAVVQRSREIGVRMALGATRANVLQLFLGLGARLLAIGMVIGLGASVAFARVVKNQVFGSPEIDAVALGFAALLLGGAAIVACWLPARRATKVDPMVALRSE